MNDKIIEKLEAIRANLEEGRLEEMSPEDKIWHYMKTNKADGKGTGKGYYSKQTLGNYSGLDRRAVAAALKAMKKAGKITAHDRWGLMLVKPNY